MKLFKYLTVVLLTVFAASCAEADQEPLHTDNTISAIQISPADTSVTPVTGEIDEDNHRILFPIPKYLRERYPDLTHLNVRATTGYDARITPALTGLHNLGDPFLITVTAGNGDTRQYTLQAYYSREGEDE